MICLTESHETVRVTCTHMEKTIRGVLRRRVRIAAAVAFCGWLFLVSFGIVSGNRKSPPGPPFFVGFLVFAGAALGANFWIKCLKCSRRLGKLGFELGFSGKKAPNFCPYCGVSLDEPVPDPSQASHANPLFPK